MDLNRILIFDGAMGTMLQRHGLARGVVPETLNVTAPEMIEEIHRAYLDAGADVILSNTFGANRFKAEQAGMDLALMTEAAVKTARRAADSYPGKYVALDIGPCGRMLAPAGDLDFEDAVSVFAEVVRAGAGCGADLVLLETFTDLYELKAAVLAAKENCDLPIFATMSFEANGRTFFGTEAESMVMTLEALGVSALGINCSLGPAQMAPVVKRIVEAASVPVLVQPNAGLPVMENGVSRYDVTPEQFASQVRDFVRGGVRFVGGCCGTTPEYIKLLKEKTAGMSAAEIKNEPRGGICSPSRQLYFDRVTVIGERINPTGKKKLQAALREGNIDYIAGEALREEEAGADALDVNVGLPDIDEPAVLAQATARIQASTQLPLQLDSASVEALSRAARIYNGKPLLNSVNGKKESLEAVLPVAKKYGCAVLGLTLDEKGVPETAEERFAIAERIVAAAEAAGIRRCDILIDCLMMTVGVQPDQALQALRAISMVKGKLGVKTALGVSNVSFGLPNRPLINRTMLAMALACGLDAPIMNPCDSGMTDTAAAARLLLAQDGASESYISKFGEAQPEVRPAAVQNAPDLRAAIRHGIESEAVEAVKYLLSSLPPLEIIDKEIIPALDAVGRDYDTGEIFITQLIQSAEAAKAAFDVLRDKLPVQGNGAPKKKKIILATVCGDIHDIGKNIVKVILENYNFDVTDLGKDVPPRTVSDAVAESGAGIVGLSALMTTTVASMKETIELLRSEHPDVKIVVGGAVLTEKLAEYVGADHYAKDAMETVKYAESI
ncbi:MAG: homocysteine S-methyltransferase family protein [Synergistes sp.]|nr:homocysteine S-methyltransferase family protein [Synergistes sp.]